MYPCEELCAGRLDSLQGNSLRAQPDHKQEDLTGTGDTCWVENARLWKWGAHLEIHQSEKYISFPSVHLAFLFPLPIHPRYPPLPPYPYAIPISQRHALLTERFTDTMVSYKSIFRAIFRPEHTDDPAATPSSSKSRPKPSRAFTVPASPARPRPFFEQPIAGPSTAKHLDPYTNNPNRHSAVALRDILSPRPRLRKKNSLPSQFPQESSTLPPRVSDSPIPMSEDAHPQEQRQLTASPVQESHQSDDYLRQPHLSPDLRRSTFPIEDSRLCDRFDTSLPAFGVRESSDISLLLSSEPADARKAISKRLEGLAMALDMFQPIQTTSPTTLSRRLGVTPTGLAKLDTSLDVTHPLISFPLLSQSPTTLGATSLSPIENWRDEEGEEHYFDDDEAEGEDDEVGSYFDIPGSKFSQSSHSSSSVSSSTSDLPPTPVDLPTLSTDAVQLLPQFLPTSPVPFNLGPVVRLKVDNCKATPTPMVSIDACDAQSGIVRL